MIPLMGLLYLKIRYYYCKNNLFTAYKSQAFYTIDPQKILLCKKIISLISLNYSIFFRNFAKTFRENNPIDQY